MEEITQITSPGQLGLNLLEFAGQGPLGTEYYYCDFPPNDQAWKPAIDNIIAAPKPVNVYANLVITALQPGNSYVAMLQDISVVAAFSQLGVAVTG